MSSSEPAAKAVTPSGLGRWLRRLVAVPLLLVLLVGFYLAIGATLTHRIDTDPDFVDAVPVPAAGLTTIATLAALVERETDRQGWVANDPVFMPGWLLHGMASFQEAIRDEVRRTLSDVAARTGAPDPDLETALGALAMPGDVWAFDFATSWRPQRTSEAHYRDAVQALRELNARLSAGTVALPLAEAGEAILARIEAGLAADAAAGLATVEAHGGVWSNGRIAADRFLANRGYSYTRLLVVHGLGRDVAAVAGAAAFEPAVAALTAASGMAPWIIANGALDGVLRPAHLAVQAALMLRARDALAALRLELPEGGA